MKKHLIILMTLLSTQIYAQEDLFQKNAFVRLTVDNIASANTALNGIFTKYSMEIKNSNINLSDKLCEYEVHVLDERLDDSLKEVDLLGVVDFKEIKSTNLEKTVKTIEYDISYLKEQKAIYSNELQMNGRNEAIYNDLFKKIRAIEEDIYEKNKKLMDLSAQIDHAYLRIRLSEPSIQDLDYDEFSGFINMPGVEGKFFHLENRDDITMAENYIGGSLRYMFTRGRTYFLIGIMKSLDASIADNEVNDIVSYCIGKDFYPRYFGNGKNTFFNPYSGFEIGGMILTSNDTISHIFTAEPHIGIEFFKNKLVIIDSRVGYIFPLHKDYIKSRRGLSANVSINFVF